MIASVDTLASSQRRQIRCAVEPRIRILTRAQGSIVHEHQLKGHAHQALFDRWQASGDLAGARTGPTANRQMVQERLSRLVAESRWILGWREIMDGRPTRPIEARTFSRAVALLTQMAYQAPVDTSAEFPLPTISPSPDGSVDLQWEHAGFELLVNVPAGPGAPATFAGEKANQIRLTGETDPEKPAEILLKWILTP